MKVRKNLSEGIIIVLNLVIIKNFLVHFTSMLSSKSKSGIVNIYVFY